jgi:YHS domain-containing protein
MNLARFLLLALCSIGILHGEEPLKDVKGMICPVKATEGCGGDYCSKKVKRDISAEHEGRKVYFCCEGCVKAFKKDPKTFLETVKEQWKVIDSKKE